jgi:hypothetical protein
MSTLTVADLDKRYPWIDWLEPIPLTVIGGRKGYGCRVCIALAGYKPIEDLMPGFNEKREEVVAHIAKEHPLKKKGAE